MLVIFNSLWKTTPPQFSTTPGLPSKATAQRVSKTHVPLPCSWCSSSVSTVVIMMVTALIDGRVLGRAQHSAGCSHWILTSLLMKIISLLCAMKKTVHDDLQVLVVLAGTAFGELRGCSLSVTQGKAERDLCQDGREQTCAQGCV